MLDGADSQYSGMQIGQPPDEDEEATGVLPDEDADAFRSSSVGRWTSAVHCGNIFFNPDIAGLDVKIFSCQDFQEEILEYFCFLSCK